jgi:predicted RNA-binding protein with PUA-like domain
MARKYWLLKCEPETYNIDDLERDGCTGWEGVRNYQARNFLRDEFRDGDGILFYASNAEPSGVTGVASVSRSAFPDPCAWDRKSAYYDAASTPDAPVWYSVEIQFEDKFPEIVPLAALKATAGLGKMVVTQKGSRLSVQPVTAAEFKIVLRLGRRKPRGATPPR